MWRTPGDVHVLYNVRFAFVKLIQNSLTSVFRKELSRGHSNPPSYQLMANGKEGAMDICQSPINGQWKKGGVQTFANRQAMAHGSIQLLRNRSLINTHAVIAYVSFLHHYRFYSFRKLGPIISAHIQAQSHYPVPIKIY